MDIAETGFQDHIRDLRKTVIYSLLSLVIGFGIAIPFTAPLINLLKIPAENSLEKMPEFIFLGPIQGFSLVMKCAFFLGALLSAPFWLLSLWRFISPGLKENEKGILIPFFSLMLLFFIGGATLGFYFILPPALQYLESFGGDLGTNMWTLSLYVEFCLFILFGSGLAFEMFFLLLLLVHFDVLTYERLSSSRRAVIVACFILGALLTPPDVATQFLMAVPLWLFFEIGVAYSYFKRKG